MNINFHCIFEKFNEIECQPYKKFKGTLLLLKHKVRRTNVFGISMKKYNYLIRSLNEDLLVIAEIQQVLFNWVILSFYFALLTIDSCRML